MKPHFSFAALGLALLASSCATQDTALRGGAAVAVTGTLFSDYETEVSAGPATGTADTDLNDLGLRAEAFTSPSSSIFADLRVREYDPKGGGSIDGNELHLGGRYYMMADQPLQPFLQAAFFYGDGLDLGGGADTDGYFGLGVGGGACYFFAQSALVEAGVRYETTLLDPQITVAGTDIDYDLSGFSGWIGLGLTF